MSEPRGAAVFVHGAGGGGWEWGVWARVFAAAGWQVHAPDLRPGPAGLAATTLGDYAAQVGAWLAAARGAQRGVDAARHVGECRAGDGRPPRVVLVGASLGGLLALASADRADALVLVNPLPPDGLPMAAPLPDIVPWGRTASLAGTRRAMPDADDPTALFAFRRWRDESGRALAEARRGLPLPAPACPVLVLASDADEDVPPARSEALAAALGARFVQVEGSHVGPLLGRQAPSVAAQVLAWLAGAGVQPEFGSAG